MSEYKTGSPFVYDTKPLDWETINKMLNDLRKRREAPSHAPMIYCGSKEKPILEWMLREAEAEAIWQKATHDKWWAKLTPAQRIREQRFADQKRKLEWALASRPVITPGDPGWQLRYQNPNAETDEWGDYL